MTLFSPIVYHAKKEIKHLEELIRQYPNDERTLQRLIDGWVSLIDKYSKDGV